MNIFSHTTSLALNTSEKGKKMEQEGTYYNLIGVKMQ